MAESRPFAEVIESSLSGWTAQSWQWDNFPSFGSLVTITCPKRTLFGVVHQIKTGPLDPIRYPFAYQKTEEELRLEQPQIFEFLKTTFSCLTLGYLQNNKITYQVAPEPPKIHAFVVDLSDNLYEPFFQHNHYLQVLFSLSNTLFNLDELLLAILKHQADNHMLTTNTIEQFVDTFSLLIGNDYRRLKLFLQRVEHIL